MWPEPPCAFPRANSTRSSRVNHEEICLHSSTWPCNHHHFFRTLYFSSIWIIHYWWWSWIISQLTFSGYLRECSRWEIRVTRDVSEAEKDHIIHRPWVFMHVCFVPLNFFRVSEYRSPPFPSMTVRVFCSLVTSFYCATTWMLVKRENGERVSRERAILESRIHCPFRPTALFPILPFSKGGKCFCPRPSLRRCVRVCGHNDRSGRIDERAEGVR